MAVCWFGGGGTFVALAGVVVVTAAAVVVVAVVGGGLSTGYIPPLPFAASEGTGTGLPISTIFIKK